MSLKHICIIQKFMCIFFFEFNTFMSLHTHKRLLQAEVFSDIIM